MLQRIQTVYLALVFVVIAIMSFLPLVIFHAGDQVFYLNLFRFVGVEGTEVQPILPNPWMLPILSAGVAIISGVSIFRYQNRKQQIKLNMFSMLLNFGLLAALFIMAESVAKLEPVNDTVIYDIASYFPIITVLLLIFANRSIRKDEKMVREADRLR